jgi:hypothetical protein
MDIIIRKKLWNDCINNKVGSPSDYNLEYQNSLTRYVKALSGLNQCIVSFDANKEKIAKDYLHLFLTDDLAMNLLSKLSTYFEVEHWPTVHDAIMQEGIGSRYYTKYFKEKFSHLFRPGYIPKGAKTTTQEVEDEDQVDLFDVLFPELADSIEDVTFQTMKEDLHNAKQEIESLMEKVQVLTEDNKQARKKLRQLKALLNDELKIQED